MMINARIHSPLRSGGLAAAVRSAVALAAGFVLVAPAAQAQTVLTASSWVPPTHSLSTTQKEWCDLLEQKSAGKLKCNILPRAPTGAPGTLDAVRNGLVDVSYTVHGYTPGRFIATQMAELPFLGNFSEPVSVALQRMGTKYPALLAGHDGVKVLTLFTHGPGVVLNTKRPIAKAADLEGLKFRVGGGMVNEIAKALNMNATLKPAPESYELLSNGVMDGTLFPAESVASFKIDKVIRHATQFPGGLYNTSFVFMMNQARYDKLSADEKKIVDSISGEFAARMFGRGWEKADRIGMATMQSAGVQFVKADAAFVKEIKDRTAPLEDKWAADAEAKGLAGAKKVLAEFRAEIAKLEK